MLSVLFKNKRKMVIYSTLILFIFIIAAFSADFLQRETFHSGVYIEGEHLSGFDRLQAKQVVKNKLAGLTSDKSINLTFLNNSWNIPKKDIAMEYSVEKALDEAYSIGRTGNFLQRLYSILKARFMPVMLFTEPSYNVDKLESVLTVIKKQIDKEAKNATVSYKNGNITVNKEEIGYIFDIDANKKIIENSIQKRNFDTITLEVTENPPRINSKDINEISYVLSSSSTIFNPSDYNRTYNIKLACEKVNGIILMPGESFSMDTVLGPRTFENGYREAPVIYMNEFIKGPGGGVCQVTTTLYGSVLKSKLGIQERIHHSLPLGYVEAGQDATIAEDYIDFKFKNNKEYPVSINAEVSGSRLTMRILGKPDNSGYTVKLKSVTVEELQPETDEIVIDESLPENTRVVVREAKKGIHVIVYRDTYNKNGEILDREKISDDIYKPVRGLVKVKKII